MRTELERELDRYIVQGTRAKAIHQVQEQALGDDQPYRLCFDCGKQKISHFGIGNSESRRALSGLVGAIVGDAVGAPFEFMTPERIPKHIDIQMPSVFNKTYSAVPYGTWSDDSSLLLCLMDSLSEWGGLNLDHFSKTMSAWLKSALHQAGGRVFDCGGTINQALRRVAAGIDPRISGSVSDRAQGNGSLMRTYSLACMAVLWELDDANVVGMAHAQSAVTHRHPVPMVCCALYTLLAKHMILGARIDEALSLATQSVMEIYSSMPVSDFLTALEKVTTWPKTNAPGGSGFVIDTYWSAIDSAMRSHSYRECIEMAVRLGNDTDTTACVAGALAGVTWAISDSVGIPESWINSLVPWPTESGTLMKRIFQFEDIPEPILSQLLSG